MTPSATLNSPQAGDDDWNPHLATDRAGKWVAVWNAGTKPSSPDIHFHLALSTSGDDGTTWSSPTLLAADQTNGPLRDSQPVVGTDGAGTWLVVWDAEPTRDEAGHPLDTRATRLFVARSVDQAATWTLSSSLDAARGTVEFPANERPHLATGPGGVWVIVWEGYDGQVGGIFAARSADNGVTWSPPQRLSPLPAIDAHSFSFPRVATDGAGGWIVSWDALATTDTRPTGWFARSVDDGATWSLAQLVDRGGQVVLPVIVSNGNGLWVAVWTDSSGVNLARSRDVGATWTESVPPPALSVRPDLSVDRDGSIVAAWRAPTNDVVVSWFAPGGLQWTSGISLGENQRANANFSPARVTLGREATWVVAWETEAEIGGDTRVALSRLDLATTSSVLRLAQYFVSQLPRRGSGPPLGTLPGRLTRLAGKIERGGRGRERAMLQARKLARTILRKVSDAAQKDRLRIPLEPIVEAGTALLDRLG